MYLGKVCMFIGLILIQYYLRVAKEFYMTYDCPNINQGPFIFYASKHAGASGIW